MKKILAFIIIIMLIFTRQVSALSYYDTVTIYTSFAEEIDMNSISEIEVFFEDATQAEKMYKVQKEENFSIVLTNIIAGNLRFDYAIVDNDRTGKYKITGNVDISTDYKTATINLLVENQNNTQNEVDLSDKVLEILSGSKTTTTTTTTKVVESGNSTSTTTNIIDRSTTTKIIYDTDEKRIQEQKENRKKNDTIGIILFSILGIILIIGVSFVIVKITKANK